MNSAYKYQKRADAKYYEQSFGGRELSTGSLIWLAEIDFRRSALYGFRVVSISGEALKPEYNSGGKRKRFLTIGRKKHFMLLRAAQ